MACWGVEVLVAELAVRALLTGGRVGPLELVLPRLHGVCSDVFVRYFWTGGCPLPVATCRCAAAITTVRHPLTGSATRTDERRSAYNGRRDRREETRGEERRQLELEVF